MLWQAEPSKTAFFMPLGLGSRPQLGSEWKKWRRSSLREKHHKGIPFWPSVSGENKPNMLREVVLKGDLFAARPSVHCETEAALCIIRTVPTSLLNAMGLGCP
jgi:hypothetical protein